MREDTTHSMFLCAALAGLIATANPASAQNALGDGRALDANPSADGNRYNTANRSFRDEVNFRNSIVTGNAASFLSFRGDSPYSNASDFRGTLGSNDLFAFRRDSLYSGLAGGGIRGTEAIQYQAALTTGARPPRDLIGSLSINQFGAGSTGSSASVRSPNPSVNIDRTLSTRAYDDEQADIRGGLLYQLRSPSAYVANRDLNTQLISVIPGERAADPNRALTASSIRGIRVQSIAGQETEKEDEKKPNPNRIDNRSANPASVNPTQVNADPLDRQTPASDLTTAFDRARQSTLDQMRAVSERYAEGQAFDDDAIERATDVVIESLRRDINSDGQIVEPDPDQDPEKDLNDASPDAVELINTPRPRIDRYFSGRKATDRDFFGEYMNAGEKLLREERYFDAEERFTAALSIKPADPTAQIARVNAQLGGGLLLSAAVNLRQVISEHPELIKTRFALELLPDEDRLDELEALLTEYVEATDDGRLNVSPALLRGSGLLMAYIGFQREKPELIVKGLDALEDFAKEAVLPGASSPDLRFARVLRHVWQGVPTSKELEDAESDEGSEAVDPAEGMDTP